MVYCQSTGTPDIFRVVEYWDTGTEGDRVPDIETEKENTAGSLQCAPPGTST